jgi:ribosome-binding factor A
MSSSFKKSKLEEKIQFFALECIRNLSDEKLMLFSVTKVELSNDFSSAKLFWDSFDPENREDIKSSLARNKGKIRTHIGRGLKIKHTP